MCLKWIEIFPQYIQAFKNTRMHHIFLVDLDAAISSCAFEIFDMIHKCFGHCPRANKFFGYFKESINYQSE